MTGHSNYEPLTKSTIFGPGSATKVLKEIPIMIKDNDKYYSVDNVLKHYNPDKPSDELTSVNFDELIQSKQYNGESPNENELAFGLPLSFDVSLLRKNEDNITIDIKKKFENEQKTITDNTYVIVDKPKNTDVGVCIATNNSNPLEPLEKKTPEYIKDYLGVPLIDPNMYNKLQKCTFNSGDAYKKMINDRELIRLIELLNINDLLADDDEL